MRKIKWVALILVICVFTGSLIGCTGGNNQKEANGNSETQGNGDGAAKGDNSNQGAASGKATFWIDKLSVESAKKISDPWSKSSGLTIDFNHYTDTASYQTAISQSIDNADAAPNAFTWWSGNQLETLAASGKLMELDDVWDDIIAMGVSPDIKQALSFNGHAYAVPYSVLNNVCLYNVNAFAKAEITAPPETFDEFLEDCQKLVDAGITPIGLKNDSWASFIWFQALTAAYDPELYIGVCDGSIKYTDEKMLEVLKVWQDMIDKGYFADPVAAADNNKRIALGECAIYIEPQGNITSLEKNYDLAPGKDIDAFALPSMTGGKKVVFFEVAPIAVPAVVKDPEASKKLLKGYYTEETQNVTLSEGGIVLTSSVKVDNPALAKISGMAADTEHYQSILRYYENTPSVLRDYALDEISKFMVGMQDASTTLGNIQVKADEVFKK